MWQNTRLVFCIKENQNLTECATAMCEFHAMRYELAKNFTHPCAYGIQPNQRQMRLDEYAFGIRHDLSGVDM